MLQQVEPELPANTAREWLQILAPYRKANTKRSIFEIIITATPFVGLWILAWWSMSISYWLTLAISVPAAGFLVRLFLIQHDCGHGSFFENRKTNDWIGRVLGVVTMTPYHIWRQQHASHHATSGHLDKRGLGDIDTLTVREYQALSPMRRLQYRLYRNPLVLFVIGPSYQFLLRNRLPTGTIGGDTSYWISAMGTNIAIAAAGAFMMYLVGAGTFLMIQLPITMLAASIGVWLFYVQHQFEDTLWAAEPAWNFHDAALFGSSHYDLPSGLDWLTAHIGVHHVHHLSSRIPFYRLPQILRDYPELKDIKRLTLWQSLDTLRLRLWDEDNRRLVSFRDVRDVLKQPAA